MSAIATGSKTLGPQAGTITVKTFKEGLLSKMGHDLVIEARQWSAKIQLDSAEPPAGSVEVEIDPKSLTIVGPGDLTDKDKAEIRGNIEKDVIQWAKFPEIKFRSTAVENVKSSGGKGTATVKGQLTLHGQTQAVDLPVSFEATATGVRVTGEVTLAQTRFGIKPYKAPLGVIKVKDELKVLWNFVAA